MSSGSSCNGRALLAVLFSGTMVTYLSSCASTNQLFDTETLHIRCPQHVYRQGYGVVLDSGTTFTYLPSPAFTEFLNAVKDYALGRGLQMTDGPDKNVRVF